jgi:peptide/nickel transport system permease protein
MMVSYVATRLLQAIPVLFLVSIAIFLFVRMIPGDPAVSIAGMNARPEQVAILREQYGLDRPVAAQYTTWLGRILRGDFGEAYTSKRPISDLILQRLPATAELAIGAMVVTILIGGAGGIFAAVRPHHPVSRLIALFNAVAIATPSFWLGILLLLLFAVRLGWLPPSGYVGFTEQPLESLKFLLLPSITLGLNGSAVLARFLSASLSETLHADYVRTAHAKGLRERTVITRHALRNALPPVITILAIQFGYLLGGAVITEAIFGWPGLGRLMLDAIKAREYLIIQGTMLVFVTAFIVVNIAADACYALVNPRIRNG